MVKEYDRNKTLIGEMRGLWRLVMTELRWIMSVLLMYELGSVWTTVDASALLSDYK